MADSARSPYFRCEPTTQKQKQKTRDGDMTRNNGKTVRTLAAVTTVAALFSGIGVAAASTLPATAAASGTEHFYLMTTESSAATYVVLANGLFTAGGTDIAGNTVDTVKLPGGTFKVNHGGASKLIKQQVNAKTCFALFEGSSTITVGSGTGRYKGISGSGSAIITDMGIAPRTAKGACNFNANPTTNEETITATAKVKL
jgi:hypothetical protein